MTTSETMRVAGYRLVARLGQGGTADVFLAVAEGPQGTGFAKLAVVKRLRPHLAEDPDFVSMLMDEGQLTARLSHPNIVQMYEVGRDGNDYFLALEHLDGQPLHHIERRAARTGTHVPKETYYAIIANVLAGLHHAHDLADFAGNPLHIVHRDVTPQNVFVTYEGVVKVVDFGIAKAMGRLTETRHGMVKGKIRYMSPEQAAGGTLDRRTDVFAAGIMLFKAATSKRLWLDRPDSEVPRALVAGDYDPSPRKIDPTVPVEIDEICRKALAFRPRDRFATAADMQHALERFIGPRPADAQRQLGKLLREMFAKDREKLRALLQSAIGPTAAVQSDIDPPPSNEERTRTMTVVMSSTTSARVAASVAPLALAVPRQGSKASRGREDRRATARRRPKARASRWKRVASAFEWGAPANLMTIALAIVLVTAAAVATATRAPATNRDGRLARIVAAERVGLAREARALNPKSAAVTRDEPPPAGSESVSLPARPRRR